MIKNKTESQLKLERYQEVLNNGNLAKYIAIKQEANGFDVRMPLDVNNATALHYSAMNPDADILKNILAEKIFDIDIQDKLGHTAMYFAAKAGSKAAMFALIDAGAKFDKDEILRLIKFNHYMQQPTLYSEVETYLNKQKPLQVPADQKGIEIHDTHDAQDSQPSSRSSVSTSFAGLPPAYAARSNGTNGGRREPSPGNEEVSPLLTQDPPLDARMKKTQ